MRPTARVVAPVAVGLLALLGVTGCSQPGEDYCAAIDDHQDELIEIAADQGPDAVFAALPVYRDLQEEAPPDLRDEWELVVSRLDTLDAAFDDAGVDPASYDPKSPDGVSKDQQREIQSAARDLGATDTREAMAGIEQQARDVCKTELGGEPPEE